MTWSNPDALVSTAWLAENLEASSLAVLDGTSHLPTVGRDAAAEFADKHIAGARRFDIDDVSDKANPLPHMLPNADVFAEKVSALGISNDHHVVVYDVYGMQSAARVWWMFRAFGHDRVSVLNGGLPKWEAEGHPLTQAQADPAPTAAKFSARFRPELVRSLDQIRKAVEGGAEQIVDVRSSGRFTAAEPEPRPGMRSGHMPGALNLPFTDLLEAPHKTYIGPDEIRARAEAAGIDLARPVATSCGSGVTACAVSLGLFLIGKEDVAVYDGSWTEWGSRDDTPVTQG